MGRVRPGHQIRNPTAAAQNPPAIQIIFFIVCAPSSSSHLPSIKVGCSEGELRFSALKVSRKYAERLHFEYGFGSVRTCVGIWGSRCRQDAADGGGCSDLSESFGDCKSYGSADGRQGGVRGGPAGGAGRPDDGPGSTGEGRSGTGQQAVWWGGVGAVCKADGRPMAGVLRGFFWDICPVCGHRRVEVAK